MQLLFLCEGRVLRTQHTDEELEPRLVHRIALCIRADAPLREVGGPESFGQPLGLARQAQRGRWALTGRVHVSCGGPQLQVLPPAPEAVGALLRGVPRGRDLLRCHLQVDMRDVRGSSSCVCHLF